MRHIQDFKKEIGDTPRIVYARIAKFACESGDAFTERQLVSLYMAKQHKTLQNMAHPHMLLMCGGGATLGHTFQNVGTKDMQRNIVLDSHILKANMFFRKQNKVKEK